MPKRAHRSLAIVNAALCLGGAGPRVAQATGQDAIALPAPQRAGAVSVETAIARRRSVREYAETPLSVAEVSQLAWAAQGITHEDGLRTAPSAGALYPLELFVVAGSVTGLPPGAYRYEAARHRLIPHLAGPLRKALADAALEQEWVAEAPLLLVFAAVYARTARKYGRRAPRYVHMEVGHAAQNVYLQAQARGLGTVMVGAFRDRAIQRILELPDRMEPVAVMPVGRPR